MSSSSPGSPPPIAVFGATGEVGRRVVAELVCASVAVSIAGRRADALDELARAVPGGRAHVADAGDGPALARAFAGARVVVNAAKPLHDTAAPMLAATLTAGTHYLN